MRMHNPAHPGLILKDEMQALDLTVTKLAKILGVSRVTVSEIINCKNRITAEMAVRIAKAFNTTPEFWNNMQASYDLWQALQTVDTEHIPVIYNPGEIEEEDIRKSA